jgi:hypothetical protein
MNGFKVGDRVYCVEPVNELWRDDYTATVLAVAGDFIDIVWDHGPWNMGHVASEFAIRAVAS